MAYWQRSDIPELDGLDLNGRQTLWSRAVAESRSPWTAALLLVFCVMGGGIVYLLTSLFPTLESGWRHHLLFACVMALLLGSYNYFVTRFFARRWLRAHRAADMKTGV